MTDLPNVILIVLDTMRKDVLPAYAGKASTPNLDALVSDSTVYPDCVAPSPWTLPSHASLFTGKYPSEHGVHESRETKVSKLFGLMARSNQKTIADYLDERGYNTLGYSANANIAPGSGFDASFNSFTFVDPARPSDQEKEAIDRASRYGKTREEAASKLLRKGKFGELWKLYRTGKDIEKRQRLRNYPLLKGGDRIVETITESSFEEPFFLFVNVFEMHEPYTTTEPTAMMDLFGKRVIDSPMLEKIRIQYGEEARTIDRFVGAIFTYLKQCGAYDSSLIIVTSDHGQALKERGYFGHGIFLYPEIVEVPLIVKYPENKRPGRPAGYQSLTMIPELIKNSLVGILDGATLSTKVAISESYGISNVVDNLRDVPDFETKRNNFDRPRKVVYQDGYRLVVDGSAGAIEEFSRAGKTVSPSEDKERVDEMLQVLASRSEPEFKIPNV